MIMQGERTVTAMFDGRDLPVKLVAKALMRFTKLLDASSKVVLRGKGGRAEWLLTDISYGSVVASAAPRLARRVEPYHEELVGHVREVAQKTASGRTNGLEPDELKTAQELRAMLNGQITGLTISTEQDQATIKPVPKRAADQGTEAVDSATALGTVVGRAQTLSSRNALMFTVYDVHTDEAVLCYVAPGERQLLDGILDKVVEVHGEIARDPMTGRAKVVRSITQINPIEPLEVESLAELAGLLSGRLPARSEALVRQLRNG